MIEAIHGVINAISGFLYQPYIVPLFLIAAGLYFTVRTGFLQVRLFGESIKVVSEKPKDKRSVSSFGALMVSTASRVGTGNIIGVSTAICLGGFGAIFWMWITAILGGASAFIESTLAQIYKHKDSDGTYYGGPSYYMQNALKQRWLGVIFAVLRTPLRPSASMTRARLRSLSAQYLPFCLRCAFSAAASALPI